MNQNKTIPSARSLLRDAHGPIRFNMTNDYMFRAVLQKNNKVLRGLLCSLLHLSEKEIASVEIINPVILGKSIDNKEFRLDINVRLNNHTLINLEMQSADKTDWQNRSLVYLCRSFDQLDHGQKYIDALPVIHIGFLDYTLFGESPEFYATYKLINVKNHHIYSDNLTLSVVNLSRIDLATDEDKKYQIDSWAKFFKSSTWEEILMLASENNYIHEAANTMYQLSADEQIRKSCLDREEYCRKMRTFDKRFSEQDELLAEQKAIIMQRNILITEQDNRIAEQNNRIAEQNDRIAEQNGRIAEQNDRIAEQNDRIAEQEALIQELLEENRRLKKNAVQSGHSSS